MADMDEKGAPDKKPAMREAFRSFAILMLAIGGIVSIGSIVMDPGTTYRLRVVFAHVIPHWSAVPAAPSGNTASRIERLHGALMRARDAVLAYRDAHGYLPDITSADVLNDLWTEAEREDFRAATDGGLLVLAVASRETDTVHLVGVYGGALSEKGTLREGVAAFSQRGDGPQPAFLRFNGGVYEGGEMSAYIPLDEAANR